MCRFFLTALGAKGAGVFVFVAIYAENEVRAISERLENGVNGCKHKNMKKLSPALLFFKAVQTDKNTKAHGLFCCFL